MPDGHPQIARDEAGGAAQRSNSPINFAYKLFAQAGLTFLIPDCGLERVLFSKRKLFDDETHEVAHARVRWCRPRAPAIQDVPERGRAGE